MRDRRLSQTEKRAWAAVARSVRPRAGALPLPKPETHRQPGPQDDAPGAGPDARQAPVPEPTRPRRAGESRLAKGLADRSGEKKVRRGQVAFTARLDLHGHTQASADAALLGFLQHHQRSGARCVLVITGKGRDGQSVLKRNLMHWLGTLNGRALVSGYAPAHARHGGGGAFYLWIRHAAAK